MTATAIGAGSCWTSAPEIERGAWYPDPGLQSGFNLRQVQVLAAWFSMPMEMLVAELGASCCARHHP